MIDQGIQGGTIQFVDKPICWTLNSSMCIVCRKMQREERTCFDQVKLCNRKSATRLCCIGSQKFCPCFFGISDQGILGSRCPHWFPYIGILVISDSHRVKRFGFLQLGNHDMSHFSRALEISGASRPQRPLLPRRSLFFCSKIWFPSMGVPQSWTMENPLK